MSARNSTILKCHSFFSHSYLQLNPALSSDRRGCRRGRRALSPEAFHTRDDDAGVKPGRVANSEAGFPEGEGGAKLTDAGDDGAGAELRLDGVVG